MSRLRPPLHLLASLVVLSALFVAGAPAAGAHDGSHTVTEGETLSDIAVRNRTTVAALAAANGIANSNRIIVGQVLVVPGAAGTAAPATVVHVVSPGETLSGIASRYGTTTGALADANGIANRNLVRIGQRLTVPTGGAASGGGGATTTPHTVVAGETLSTIASRYGSTVGALVSANGISNPNLVRIGQRLTIVGAGSGGSGGSASTSAYATTGSIDGRTGVAGTHTVGSGETLRGIAQRYGVAIEALAAANGIPRPWNLYAGARLNLSATNRAPVDIAQCPVPGSTFANDWGFPRSGGRAHTGNDMFAPRGTPVLAPVSGTVSYSTGTIGGRQFRLVGDDGMRYLGSHLDAFGTAGRVSQGATIGYVGTSGNAAGGRPHLHLEIHPDSGAAMNPFPVLVAVC